MKKEPTNQELLKEIRELKDKLLDLEDLINIVYAEVRK
jgi:hypothetical protein